RSRAKSGSGPAVSAAIRRARRLRTTSGSGISASARSCRRINGPNSARSRATASSSGPNSPLTGSLSSGIGHSLLLQAHPQRPESPLQELLHRAFAAAHVRCHVKQGAIFVEAEPDGALLVLGQRDEVPPQPGCTLPSLYPLLRQGLSRLVVPLFRRPISSEQDDPVATPCSVHRR